MNNHLSRIAARLGCRPAQIYVMDQRTKWGKCSSRRNLSFNWRLILAPEYVLQWDLRREVGSMTSMIPLGKFERVQNCTQGKQTG